MLYIDTDAIDALAEEPIFVQELVKPGRIPVFIVYHKSLEGDVQSAPASLP